MNKQEKLIISLKDIRMFQWFKISSMLFALTVLSAILSIIFSQIQALEHLLNVAILSSFFLFFSVLVSFIVFMIQFGKKQNEARAVIIKDLWVPLLNDVTMQDDDYQIISKKTKEAKLITHGFIPSNASETYVYGLTHESSQTSLHAVSYTHITSTGQQASQYTDFKGYAVFTQWPCEGELFIRKSGKGVLGALQASLSPIKKAYSEDGYDINGTFEDIHKTILKNLSREGFDDVKIICQDQKLVVLITTFHVFPKIYANYERLRQENLNHINKIVRLIDVIRDTA